MFLIFIKVKFNETLCSLLVLYGLEVIVPTGKALTILETQYKILLKQALSLPTTVADPAVYLLTGALHVEAVILSLWNRGIAGILNYLFAKTRHMLSTAEIFLWSKPGQKVCSR